MLLTFSVYSAQNLDVAEEIAKKINGWWVSVF